MEKLTLECLQCGETREVELGPASAMHAGDCARCGYLGWARTTELSELARRALRDRPPQLRRLRAVA